MVFGAHVHALEQQARGAVTTDEHECPDAEKKSKDPNKNMLRKKNKRAIGNSAARNASQGQPSAFREQFSMA